ncbi:MAG: hypothetical protein EBV47_01520, partial [Actinobacteria bacterium]|nr:hypothetical protein [Actinomycetota bacterium]
MKKIRIGMVCPYGWDTPGGVQTHMKDLAEYLISEGHYVSVLAPVSDDSIRVEDYVVNAGKPISIPVNGSVARVLFGPLYSGFTLAFAYFCPSIPFGITTASVSKCALSVDLANSLTAIRAVS